MRKFIFVLALVLSMASNSYAMTVGTIDSYSIPSGGSSPIEITRLCINGYVYYTTSNDHTYNFTFTQSFIFNSKRGMIPESCLEIKKKH
jgi:hypothetical protein